MRDRPPQTSPRHRRRAPRQQRPARRARRSGQSLWALGSILVRDFQWVGWLPALVSLWYFRVSLWRQPEAWVLVLLCLLFGAALVRLNMVAGYLGERHAKCWSCVGVSGP